MHFDRVKKCVPRIYFGREFGQVEVPKETQIKRVGRSTHYHHPPLLVRVCLLAVILRKRVGEHHESLSAMNLCDSRWLDRIAMCI